MVSPVRWRPGPPTAGYTGSIVRFRFLIFGVVLVVASLLVDVGARVRATAQEGDGEPAASHEDAARLFFNGDYDAAAELSLRLRAAAPEDLATFEQRSAALHFQIRRELSGAADRKRALRECQRCAALIDAVRVEVVRGRTLAHARVERDPNDVEALFFLGKLNLTHVWLYNDTLGHRTGWGEYREARRVLEHVLERDPDHVRARVAYAWIDYIVDTRVPRLFKWALGGGNRKRALASMREAATLPGPASVRAEARFALWDMLSRDGQMADATAVARELAQEYPENREIRRFLDAASNARP